ncbi:MAG: hypothetical protein IJE40_06545 [Clostridia bacterium]|nr:hypothetical protein [Clostridia bacterium]
MNQNHIKTEALDLIRSLNTSRITVIYDGIRIWEEIIRNIRIIEEENSHHIYDGRSTPIAAPFVQGDSFKNIQGLPDILYVNEDYVFGIEHFQFDASSNNRKGSSMKTEEFIIKEKINEKFKGVKHYNEKVYMNVDFSYDNYKKSLFKSFDHHADNIEKYRSVMSLLYPDRKILLGFFIEDVTALGNFIRISGEIQSLKLFQCRDFLDKLSAVQNLDYIITKNKILYPTDIQISQITKDSMQILKKNSLHIDSNNYYKYKYGKSYSSG